MKYVDPKAVHTLLGKILPVSAEFFTDHVDRLLTSLNSGMAFPQLAGATDTLLANNRANKEGVWGFCKDLDFDIVEFFDGKTKFQTNVRPDRKAAENVPKPGWRVLYNLKIENHFNGTPWIITFPLQMIMKHYPHHAHGNHMGYCHGIVLMNEDVGQDEYYYYGVTKRGWLTRMAEHFRAIEKGKNNTFYRAWRNYVGQRDVMLSSTLLCANHTKDEIMAWEEQLVDEEMAKGTCLNMIPGGYKGAQELYKHGYLKSPRPTLKDYDRAREAYARDHPRKGIPNLLVSQWWQDKDNRAKAICAPAKRLTPEQVCAIRKLGEEGMSPEDIAEKVGALDVPQVKRVLKKETYNDIECPHIEIKGDGGIKF